MRLIHASAFAVAAALVMPAVHAQRGGQQMDADRKVANGGIHVAGWQGRPDSGAVNDSRFAQEGDVLHITTGPATSYWNPANVAKGNYMVSATFNEPKQEMNHPHPFGIFVGGNDLGTDQQTLLYCVAYRNGKPLVRGFNGTTAFNVLSLSRADPPVAGVNVAAADQPVTQQITWTVMNGTAECSINGTSIGKWDAAATTGAGKLKALDGVYGLRIAHNVDVRVTGLSMMKH
jgi:hypothetical protein